MKARAREGGGGGGNRHSLTYTRPQVLHLKIEGPANGQFFRTVSFWSGKLQWVPRVACAMGLLVVGVWVWVDDR